MHRLTASTLRQCSVEHLEKMKGSNLSDNNSNEISEHIERPLICTSCREVLYLVKLKEMSVFVLSLLELQQPWQKKYFSTTDFTWKSGFPKQFVPTGKHHVHIWLVELIYTAMCRPSDTWRKIQICTTAQVLLCLKNLDSSSILEKPVDELKFCQSRTTHAL